MNASYTTPPPAVQRRRTAVIQVPDDGCEVATSCFDCPLSRCKHDDHDWYRFWRRHIKHLRMGQEIERDGLTLEEAAVRFRITDRRCSGSNGGAGWPPSA